MSIVALAHTRWSTDRARILARDNADAASSFSRSSSPSSSSASSSSSSSSGSESDDDGTDSVASEDISLLPEMQNARLPFNNNIEQERRDTALAFRLRVEEHHDLLLGISEAVLLLQLADWDIGVALASFRNHEEARDRLRVAFDGMRDKTDDTNEQSARVSALVDITERPDWLSIKLFLEKKKWDLVRAVVSWYKKGIRPFRSDDIRIIPKDRPHWACRVDHNGKVRDKPTAEECRVDQEADDNLWADEDADFTNEGDDNPPEPFVHSQLQGRSYKAGRVRPPGYIFHSGDNSTIKPGPPDHKKLLLEYMSKGQYRFNLFSHPKYFFPDRVDDFQDDVEGSDTEGDSDEDNTKVSKEKDSDNSSSSSPSPPPKGSKRPRKSQWAAGPPRKRAKLPKPVAAFDFETSSHLADLNAWRRQNRSRIAGTTLREAAQEWTQEELDFLYQLSQEWLDNLKAQHPTETRKDLLENGAILTITKENWAKRMSEKFTGTIPAGAKTNEPRRERKSAAIMTMRGRSPRLFIHFRVNPDKKWLARLSAEEIARLERERDEMENIDMLLTAAAKLEEMEKQKKQKAGEKENKTDNESDPGDDKTEAGPGLKDETEDDDGTDAEGDQIEE